MAKTMVTLSLTVKLAGTDFIDGKSVVSQRFSEESELLRLKF
jgi:hypothetical protein